MDEPLAEIVWQHSNRHWYTAPTIRDGRGPERTYNQDDADPSWQPRAAGFTASPGSYAKDAQAVGAVANPLLWDGD